MRMKITMFLVVVVLQLFVCHFLENVIPKKHKNICSYIATKPNYKLEFDNHGSIKLFLRDFILTLKTKEPDKSLEDKQVKTFAETSELNILYC